MKGKELRSAHAGAGSHIGLTVIDQLRGQPRGADFAQRWGDDNGCDVAREPGGCPCLLERVVRRARATLMTTRAKLFRRRLQ